MTTPWRNRLHFGDNLPILRDSVPDESVDLVYLDPPFNSNATYNVLFRENDSSESDPHCPAHSPSLWRRPESIAWPERPQLPYAMLSAAKNLELGCNAERLCGTLAVTNR